MVGDPAFTADGIRVAAPILSVSALNRSVRDLLEHRFPIVWVAGEISNLTQARSGHLYFSLKDAQAQVRCVMFRARGGLLEWQPRDGMQVEVHGLITLYEPRGEFQLNVDTMRRAGVGALYEAFLRLRDRLAAEGLFDPTAKRALPPFPRAIGVVTSLEAAALRDVLNTLARRNPAIPVVVYRTAVQGEHAAFNIVTALRTAGRRRECDVLILCRGGGSLEDLQAFNNERVARTIRASPIPVVVGVGHETDFTIADFAADVRAPTPTAAAELVSPLRAELLERIGRLLARAHRCARRAVETRMQHLDHVTRRLVHPGRALAAQEALRQQLAARLDRALAQSLEQRRWRLRNLLERSARRRPLIEGLALRLSRLIRDLDIGAERTIARQQARLEACAARLAALDPRAVLARGFSIVRDCDGQVVRAATQVTRGEAIDITFAAGGADARIERVRAE